MNHTQDHPWRDAPHRLALRWPRTIPLARAATTPGIETWGDAGHLLGATDAERLDACRGFAAATGARGFNVYMGGRFAWLSGGSAAGWTPGVVAGLAAEGYGVFGTWVSLGPGQGGYDLGHADALDAIAVAKRDYPAVRILSWDVEPSAWWANITGVIAAMRGFHDAVHQAGYLDMPYGWEATCAACPWADRIWVASPGYPDPAHLRPQLPDDFLPGRRSVQYGWVNVGGTDWDISHSEFSLLEDTMTDGMTDGQIAAVVIDWYDRLLNRWAGPGTPDWPYVLQWVEKYKAGPVQARFDFGVAAEAEMPGRDLRTVRHFELGVAPGGVVTGPHKHPMKTFGPDGKEITLLSEVGQVDGP